MLKKINKIIFLACIVLSSSFDIRTQDFVKNSDLDNFFQHLQEFRLNAPWIERELINLKFEDFYIAFNEVIDILTKEDRRWFYFCDNKNDFDQEYYWHKFLWQCMHYDHWISKVYVDLINSELSYHENPGKLPKGFISLINYIDLLGQSDEPENELVISMNHFYLFYLDCLSYLFCESIDNAYKFINDSQSSNHYLNLARKSLNFFERNLKKIKSSRFFLKYSLSLKRYKEIINLLEQEKIVKMLGGL